MSSLSIHFLLRQVIRTALADSAFRIMHGVRGRIRARGSNCYRGIPDNPDGRGADNLSAFPRRQTGIWWLF
jgi:hypothetical protein